MVLGVVVGAVVDGTDVVVGGVGEPAFPSRGIGGGDDCAYGRLIVPDGADERARTGAWERTSEPLPATTPVRPGRRRRGPVASASCWGSMRCPSHV